ncbi:MAG: HPr family phosphocarrier protein [Myxococcales bacterium]|nr:HPr family phosphocarrier protein [Myxococcales bacterium]
MSGASDGPEPLERSFEIVNRLGLHARAAAKLVQLASGFEARIEAEKDGQRVDAKSIMGLLLLCGQRGSRLHFSVSGPDAAQALDAIGALLEGRFGEEE